MRILILFLLISQFFCCKEIDKPQASGSASPNEPGSTVEIIEHTLTSTYVDDEYPIQICLPENYNDSHKYPVIYVLDGKSRFDVVLKLVGEMKITAIVVGIGNTEMRDRDYMPVNTCHAGGGGHTNYYKFLTLELIPYIDSHYQTDKKNRTLVGHSFSAAMALISLFSDDLNDPLINSYIANDPSILCEPNFFNGLLPTEKGSVKSPTITLHISKSFQNTYDLYLFGNTLKNKGYPWLKLDWQEFTSEDHNSIVEPSFKAGLAFIFNK